MNVRAATVAFLALALALACGEAGPRVEITHQRTASRPSGLVVRDATPELRFFEPEAESQPPPANPIAYDLPEGWKDLGSTRDRMVNVRPAGDPEASCYLTFLQGAASGLTENVNRWRRQFGAEPLGETEVAALPKERLLGREASVVEVAGTFTGMGEGAPRAGFKLLGLAVCEPSGSLFLKFTGPAGLLDLERERFFAFARSLRAAEDHVHSTGSDAMGSSPAGEGTARTLTWTLPGGWQELPPRPPREANFVLGEGGECTVTRLGGDAGGLRANLDRWCDQLGKPKLDDEAFAALARVTMLGQAVPVLAVEGTYTGMDGVPREGQGLLAVACIRPTDSLFVKLTGPEELVRSQLESFKAFVVSLEERP